MLTLQVLSDYEHFVPLNLPVPDKIETIVNLAPRLMYDRPSPSATRFRECVARCVHHSPPRLAGKSTSWWE
jgi:hypothetical protein